MHAEESGVITSLPILFENLVVEVLLTLKEVVIETHHGETEVGKTKTQYFQKHMSLLASFPGLPPLVLIEITISRK